MQNNKKLIYIIIISAFLLTIISEFSMSIDDIDVSNYTIPSNVISRTSSTEVIKNLDGTQTITLYGGNVFVDISNDRTKPRYVNIVEDLFPVISSSRAGYDYQLNSKYTNYSSFFRNNSNTAGAVRFEKDGYFFTYDLSGGQLQWHEQPGFPSRTDTLGGGVPSNSQNTQLTYSKNKVIYPGAFSNTNVTYELKSDMLKETFILLNLPSIKPYTYLEYTGNIKFNSSLKICANNVCYIPKGTQDDFETSGKIEFKDINNKTIFYLKEPTITDANGSQVTGIYSVHGSNAQMNFWLRIPTSFLQTAQFPIYIDPTISLSGDSFILADADVNSASPDTNTGSATTLSMSSTKRAYLLYNISTLYSYSDRVLNYTSTSLYPGFSTNGNTNVGGILLYFDKLTNSTGGNNLTESTITWNNQPCGTSWNNVTNCNFSTVVYFNPAGATSQRHYDFGTYVNSYYLRNQQAIGFAMNASASSGTWYTKENSNSAWSLSVDYLPYISVDSPSQSQVFSQDNPTAYFNISTNTNMDTCYWSNGTNYSMTKVNNTYFFNDSVGDILGDGNQNVSFYCNQTSDGIWKKTEDIIFYIDAKNVTKCRDMYTAREYLLNKNLTSTDLNPCLGIQSSNVILNGGGNFINVTAGRLFKALSVQTGTAFNNIDIYSNTTLFCSEAQECGANQPGFDLSINNSRLYGRPLLTISFPFQSLGTTINITSTVLNNTILKSYGSGTDSSSRFNVLNSSYQNVTETLTSASSTILLSRRWFASVNVKNNLNNNIEFAVINITNNTGNQIFSGLSDAAGNIPNQVVVDYVLNSTSRYYQTPHNITVDASGFSSNITAFNFSSLLHSVTHNVILYDNSPPSITINDPDPITYTTNNSLTLNYDVSDNLVSVLACWYKIVNSSGAVMANNISLPNCQDTTFGLPGVDDDYILTVYSNDSLNNLGSANVSFSVRVNTPNTILNSPSNNTWLTNGSNVLFNYTSTFGTGLGTCQLWANFNGTWVVNYTWINPTNATANWTYVNLSDGIYSWNVACNNSLGLIGWGSSNRTLSVDTILPSVDITLINTVLDSKTIYFNTNISDSNLNSSSCKYKIVYPDNIVYNSLENISFTCNSLTQVDLNDFGQYNLTVYAKDYANQESSISESFSISASPTGGGSFLSIGSSQKVPVIGLLSINSTKNYTDLNREIIYSTINNECLYKINLAQTVAVADYSKVCYLVADDFNIILEKLGKNGLFVLPSDLQSFYISYKKQQLFQGYETQEIVSKYDLFTSILGSVNTLNLVPPSIDKTKIITSNSTKIIEIVYSNKPLRSCEVVGNNTGFTCEVTNATLKVIYNLNSTDFFSHIFTGIISVTTDANIDEIEQKKIPVVLRVYNLSYEIAPGVPVYYTFYGGGLLLIGGIYYSLRVSRRRNGILKDVFSTNLK